MTIPRKSDIDLFLALDAIGMSSLTDDDCCQLLAWFHHDGGCSEVAVLNYALNRDLKIAQQRLNICSGQVPNIELIERFNMCIQALSSGNKPDWYERIVKKYNLSVPS